MIDKIGYLLIVIGGASIAAKQPLATMIWGYWNYPNIDMVQGSGIFSVVVGFALVFYEYTRRKN